LPNPIFTQQIPLLKLAFVFALGIVSYRFLSSFIGESIVLYGTLTLIMITIVIIQWSALHFHIKSIACWILVFLLGFQSHSLVVDNRIYKRALLPLMGSGVEKSIEVKSIKETDRSIAVEGRVIGAKIDSVQIETDKVGVIIYIKKDLLAQQLLPGQLLVTSQNLQLIVPEKSSEFYFYDKYLIGKGIEYRVFLNKELDGYIDYEYAYSRIHTIRYSIRTWASQKLENTLKEKPNQVAQALILGRRSFLDQELKSEFARSGIIHILAVSGLHVSFVVYILFHILNGIFYRSDSYHPFKVILLILALLFYAELAGGAVPVWRATIMTISFLVAKSINKRFSTLNLLGLAAFLILLADPIQLFSVSFQLSFAAVIGIITFFPIVSRFWEPEFRLFQKARDIFGVGITAQVVTLILAFLKGALESILNFLIQISSWVSEIPISALAGYSLEGIEGVFIILSIVSLAFYLHTERPKALLFTSLFLLTQALAHSYFIYYPN